MKKIISLFLLLCMLCTNFVFATDKELTSNHYFSFEELTEIFPEASLDKEQLDVIASNYKEGIMPLSTTDINSPKEIFYKELENGSTINLLIYDDGSFITYGSLMASNGGSSGSRGGSYTTSGNTRTYSNVIIYWEYWGLYTSISYSINYTFYTNTHTYSINNCSLNQCSFASFVSLTNSVSRATMKANAFDPEYYVILAGLYLSNTIDSSGVPVVSAYTTNPF